MHNSDQMEWRAPENFVDYGAAQAEMDQRVAAIHNGSAPECIWFLEHPPLYTAGTSAKPTDLLDPNRFPVHATGRGGQYTYHGPGQRIAYVMLDLRKRGRDLGAFVHGLEDWIIAALARFDVRGERRKDRVGIWVVRDDGREDKVAAIGVRVRRWVTFHGLAINVNPELSHFEGIIPCGIAAHGVTSLHDLGQPVTMAQVDEALRETFSSVFPEMPKELP
ncbi:lipoyl(octanoyl) transferase LipB [Magnetospira sp. QH-2]|uniref:lipoyl(octanoyl) transferase LipB n=1 Tax=Magnetospira sp. (strain QH-2) TaxID=1288970 RepID=UPI0003E80F8C|nr:lipoyl(octanoyl) transferase LipB [Magnetospira sp. QH-2]CCQ74050.1 Lipoate biosynthesis protein B; Lipoate-protein ligase B [Magnetospira sp. QH-2]